MESQAKKSCLHRCNNLTKPDPSSSQSRSSRGGHEQGIDRGWGWHLPEHPSTHSCARLPRNIGATLHFRLCCCCSETVNIVQFSIFFNINTCIQPSRCDALMRVASLNRPIVLKGRGLVAVLYNTWYVSSIIAFLLVLSVYRHVDGR